jgi:2-hydroxychromene-2-carboxylate isomerase
MTSTDTGATPRVDFWFDPACPFSWMTSRWITEVAQARPLDLHWHVMSLAVLNEGQELPPQYAEKMGAARQGVRLAVAAAQRHGDDVLAALYTALGTRIYRDGRAFDVTVAAEALAEVGLDADLVDALDDASLDDAVAASHREGQQAVGEDVGTPVVAVDGRAFFGPVITPIAHGQEGLDLFEGLRLLSGTSAFSELKRARNGPPDFG